MTEPERVVRELEERADFAESQGLAQIAQAHLSDARLVRRKLLPEGQESRDRSEEWKIGYEVGYREGEDSATASRDAVREESRDGLREALERIAAGHPDGGPWSGGAEDIARAALAEFDEGKDLLK